MLHDSNVGNEKKDTKKTENFFNLEKIKFFFSGWGKDDENSELIEKKEEAKPKPKLVDEKVYSPFRKLIADSVNELQGFLKKYESNNDEEYKYPKHLAGYFLKALESCNTNEDLTKVYDQNENENIGISQAKQQLEEGHGGKFSKSELIGIFDEIIKRMEYRLGIQFVKPTDKDAQEVFGKLLEELSKIPTQRIVNSSAYSYRGRQKAKRAKIGSEVDEHTKRDEVIGKLSLILKDETLKDPQTKMTDMRMVMAQFKSESIKVSNKTPSLFGGSGPDSSKDKNLIIDDFNAEKDNILDDNLPKKPVKSGWQEYEPLWSEPREDNGPDKDVQGIMKLLNHFADSRKSMFGCGLFNGAKNEVDIVNQAITDFSSEHSLTVEGIYGYFKDRLDANTTKPNSPLMQLLYFAEDKTKDKVKQNTKEKTNKKILFNLKTRDKEDSMKMRITT